MRTVRLYGDLGKKYGRVHNFHIKSPAEAIRALVANFPSIQKYLIDSEKDNVGYIVKNGNETLEGPEFLRDPAAGEIKIIPTIAGASAAARIIVGSVLIVAGFLLAPYSAGTSTFLITAGSSLVLGGVVELLSPTPKLGQPPEGVDSKPSYFFNGPVNTTAQGQPVSVGYGRLIVGGAIISAGIVVEQILSGYRIVRQERTVEITATFIEDNYSTTPPASYFRKELLSYDPVGFYDFEGSQYVALWIYQFYYYEDIQELVPV